MERMALVSNVHGNPTALEAELAVARDLGLPPYAAGERESRYQERTA